MAGAASRTACASMVRSSQRPGPSPTTIIVFRVVPDALANGDILLDGRRRLHDFIQPGGDDARLTLRVAEGRERMRANIGQLEEPVVVLDMLDQILAGMGAGREDRAIELIRDLADEERADLAALRAGRLVLRTGARQRREVAAALRLLLQLLGGLEVVRLDGAQVYSGRLALLLDGRLIRFLFSQDIDDIRRQRIEQCL